MNGLRIASLVSGTLFGAGLTVSGMTDPARVRGFLDLLGDWDPTLAFVMGGALAVMALAWMVQKRLGKPLLAGEFSLPGKSDITSPLVIGAALFGVGWGIGGLCPGPGIAALAIDPASAAIFVVAMLGGMFLAKVATKT